MNRAQPAAAELTGRCIIVFAALQALDVITTVLGWRLGARETNVFILRFMPLGAVTGLIVAKMLGVLAVIIVLVAGKLRLVRLVNLWFAGIVTWNLIIIWIQAGRR
jgi:hypothetical protein